MNTHTRKPRGKDSTNFFFTTRRRSLRDLHPFMHNASVIRTPVHDLGQHLHTLYACIVFFTSIISVYDDDILMAESASLNTTDEYSSSDQDVTITYTSSPSNNADFARSPSLPTSSYFRPCSVSMSINEVDDLGDESSSKSQVESSLSGLIVQDEAPIHSEPPCPPLIPRQLSRYGVTKSSDSTTANQNVEVLPIPFQAPIPCLLPTNSLGDKPDIAALLEHRPHDPTG